MIAQRALFARLTSLVVSREVSVGGVNKCFFGAKLAGVLSTFVPKGSGQQAARLEEPQVLEY